MESVVLASAGLLWVSSAVLHHAIHTRPLGLLLTSFPLHMPYTARDR
jgi:hypothetical protein